MVNSVVDYTVLWEPLVSDNKNRLPELSNKEIGAKRLAWGDWYILKKY